MGEGEDEGIVEKIKEFKRRIEEKFDVDRIIIFGSTARGERGEDSDVDLIVVSRKFGMKDFFDVAPKLYEEWDLGYPVDFIIYSKEEFEELKRKVSLVSEALREGIEIE